MRSPSSTKHHQTPPNTTMPQFIIKCVPLVSRQDLPPFDTDADPPEETEIEATTFRAALMAFRAAHKDVPLSHYDVSANVVRQGFAVVHMHRFGSSLFHVQCHRQPSEAEVVEALDIDYEPDKDEEIWIGALREPVIMLDDELREEGEE